MDALTARAVLAWQCKEGKSGVCRFQSARRWLELSQKTRRRFECTRAIVRSCFGFNAGSPPPVSAADHSPFLCSLGFGTRLRPLTLTLPKPLVEFCNKAMM